jgi:hypothetical protein
MHNKTLTSTRKNLKNFQHPKNILVQAKNQVFEMLHTLLLETKHKSFIHVYDIPHWSNKKERWSLIGAFERQQSSDWLIEIT